MFGEPNGTVLPSSTVPDSKQRSGYSLTSKKEKHAKFLFYALKLWEKNLREKIMVWRVPDRWFVL